MQFLIYEEVTFNPEAIDFFEHASADTTLVTFRSGKSQTFDITPAEFGIFLKERLKLK